MNYFLYKAKGWAKGLQKGTKKMDESLPKGGEKVDKKVSTCICVYVQYIYTVHVVHTYKHMYSCITAIVHVAKNG